MIILGFFRPRWPGLAFSCAGCSAQAQSHIQFHTSNVCSDKMWRVRNGHPRHKLQFGPLTDLPDYSFIDGRPTPMGARQLNRARKQEILAVKMVTLISEIDFAVDRHKKNIEDQQSGMEREVAGRLKEKGGRLLKENNIE